MSQGRDQLIRIWTDYNQTHVISVQSLFFCTFSVYQNYFCFIEPSHDEIVLLNSVDMKFTKERIPKPKHSILCLQMIQNCVILGCEDGIVYRTGVDGLQELYNHSQPVICLFHCNGSTVSASADGLILLHQNSNLIQFQINTGVSKIALFKDVIIASCWDGAVVSIDIKTRQVKRCVEHRKGLRSLAFGVVELRKEFHAVFCGSDDARISCWSI